MRVIKRKKGNIEYFYLQHSFRKGKKVITKEKYLGKEIPKNIENVKKELIQERKKDLYKRIEKIKENKRERTTFFLFYDQIAWLLLTQLLHQEERF